MFRSVLRRPRTRVRKERIDRELDAELRFHVDMQIEQNLRRGMSPQEARRAALCDFGGVEKIREECRDARAGRFVEAFAQDARYAFRTLRRSKGFATVAILTLALGIGTSAAMFSIVYGVILRAQPYADPDRLVVLRGSHPEEGTNPFSVSLPDFRDWQAQSDVFAGMAALAYWTFNLTDRPVPERLVGARVTGELFDVLGVHPLLGRALTAEDDRPGGEYVVVLGHGAWQRLFGGADDLLGQALTLNGRPHTVVGVMPPDFRFPAADVELWAPLGDQLPGTDRAGRFLLSVARLTSDVGLEQAQTQIDAIAQRLEHDYPASNSGWRVRVVSLHETLVGDVRLAMLMLLAATGFVLLITCANVANLLMARASTRRRECAVRAALGASRSRLARQFLTESLLLSTAGGAAGVLVAIWGLAAFRGLEPASVPRLDQVGIDLVVCGFTVGVSLLITILFGLLPAIQGASVESGDALTHGARACSGERREHRLRGALVSLEVALALVLLIGGGLLIQSFSGLLSVNPGFDPRNVLTMGVFLGPPRYRAIPDQKAYVREVLERLDRLPGVIGAAAISHLPVSGGASTQEVLVEGRVTPIGETPTANYRVVSPGYFATMGIPLLRGRLFTEADTQRLQRVIIVNETMARRFWLGHAPVGRRVRWARSDRDDGWLTIVGVVGDVKTLGLDAQEDPAVYAPYTQRTFAFLRWTSFVVRMPTDPASSAAMVRAQLLSVDPDQPVHEIATMEQVLSRSVARPRLNTFLLALFAALALALATVGVYGIVSHAVAQRTHEMGVRIALGARRLDVLTLAIRHGLTPTLAGIVVGLAGALGLTHLFSSLLFGVSATDPVTFAGTAALLGIIAFVASYVPARCAAKVDPLVVLRHE